MTEPPNDPPESKQPTSLADWIARAPSDRARNRAAEGKPADLDRRLLEIIRGEQGPVRESSTDSVPPHVSKRSWCRRCRPAGQREAEPASNCPMEGEAEPNVFSAP
jgi:hypothetical protein